MDSRPLRHGDDSRYPVGSLERSAAGRERSIADVFIKEQQSDL